MAYTARQIREGARRALGRVIPGLRPKPAPAYYPQQPSCQIPTLHHLYSLFLGEREDGVFVEVGAYDGVFVSNTWGLAARGWRGYLVEPVPSLAAASRRNHRDHDGITVHETAIGDGSVAELTLYIAGTLTTANATQKQEYESVEWARNSVTEQQIVVPSVTLDAFLAAEGIPEGFDVLTVDVEGFEAQVFAGFALSAWRPRLMVIEVADTHPDLSTTRDRDARLGRDIADAGYVIAYKDAINTVFVRDDVWASAFGL